MAFQTRSRDPLLDSNMQAAIEKRGKELIGIALLGLGLMAAAMIGSYTPDDPNWMVSTDAPVQNWMGRMGASVAAPLFMVVGWGGVALAVTLLAWGVRFLLHQGAERVIGRIVFAPVLIAVGSVYAATLVPGAEWRATHSFGLGGLFGDTVMGALLTLVPISSHFAVKLMSLLMAIGMLALGTFVCGFSRAELERAGRFLLVGLILAYGTLASLLGRGASSGVQAALSYREKRAAAAEQARAAEDDTAWFGQEEEEPQMFETDVTAPPPIEVAAPAAPTKTGLFSRVPNLIRRADPDLANAPMPQPELVESAPQISDEDLPGDDRISQKIANAVRVRRAAGQPPEPDPNLPLTKGRGRRPEPLVFNPDPAPHAGLPPEPPLTAAHAPAAPAEFSAEAPASPGLSQVPPAPTVGAPAADTGYGADLEPDRVPAEELPTYAPAETAEPAITARAEQPAEGLTIPVAEPRKVVVEQPQRRAPEPSTRAKAEAQPRLAFDEADTSDFDLPPLSLLANPAAVERHHLSDEALEENARMLESVLDDYGVKGEIVSVRPGPVVTMYELEPAPGLKASRVIGLADDIARSMSALSARVSTVPGRSVIGIELPNEKREMVSFREILSSRDYGDGTQNLPLALGKDIGGDAMVADLSKMPHLLIAGTTGSGKSVAINTMILSLLYKLTPDECRLIMIDPKMLELSVYDGIPHLLSPVVTDPKKAVVALKWVVGEMEDRYRKMSKMGVRNIAGYNGRVKEALAKGEMFSRTVQTGFDDDTGEPVFETEEFAPEALPYIVVIVDEMADLMMVAGKEIEACIQRLAQMARASGIHLIMATQRPSVDVITGTIKANFPTRISFQVTGKIDSRTILGEMGAEQLLGMGDMLYMAGGAKITRCHGPFVSDEEVEEVVTHLKQFGPPAYVGTVLDGPDDEKADDIDAVLGLSTGGNTTGEDALYDSAVQIVIKDRKCSTSYIQRKLAIGYNKAARLVEQMEDEGLVSPANHVGKREILVPEQ
ncbi:DNA translocase FtsK 4TM domain-containing protein [Phaeobacter gallaeciensis]|uniref:DNA translocase FtsK 4TM domain-containing protein n=1 Tax=Phaeobacter gallaeciensis TaxID=60890 RepID=UPI00237F91BE|nr:DNA translocase FtsK 4TM domain-containing protein [Phaeobacter gallaeciensis]MDE4097921.1 DNA translocase FtsK 4TM domain-containing protein [Phaeobacter gallaeciensis]MDE4106820.1 DNA translocase FtsK 4TM domain-containing protein [Phaeobacter gallaeciensis]MDE4111274.1 DNA translocase FtsK 4TM domain-containing protein [Phaeobacter gallaeciensis]MDE4115656.1 DNA translocase FtsK 4TM domain-containing protein [Phaeobacter gallaeciensis]MDE4120215.1 DNA translocase FtsK 4TM domain-containi